MICRRARRKCGVVPTIVDTGKVVRESTVIEVWPRIQKIIEGL